MRPMQKSYVFPLLFWQPIPFCRLQYSFSYGSHEPSLWISFSAGMSFSYEYTSLSMHLCTIFDSIAFYIIFATFGQVKYFLAISLEKFCRKLHLCCPFLRSCGCLESYPRLVDNLWITSDLLCIIFSIFPVFAGISGFFRRA